MTINVDKIFIKSWRPFLWIAFVGILLYSKTLFFDLTFLDDNVWIQDYGWYLKNAGHIKEVFVRPDLISKVFYRPMVSLSFIIDAHLYGGSLIGYHFSNVLFHLIGAMLVFALFCRLGYERITSFLFALVFCVHPVLTSAVAWIPGRTDSLLGGFVLSSFLFFLGYLKKRRALVLIGHLFFLVCALLTKETAIILPILCVLYFFLFPSDKKDLKKGIALFVCWIVVMSVWGWGLIISSESKIPFLIMVQTMVKNAPSIVNYLGKACFPFRLSVLPVLRDLTFIEGFITIIVITIGLYFSRQRRWPVITFGLAWFVLFLAPALIVSFLKHEYRLYLPLVGFLVILLEMARGRGGNLKGLHIFVVAVVGLFTVLTWGHSRHYKDRFAFWENAVATSKHSPLAHRNLGAMYQLEGKIDLAKEAYQKPLSLNPHEAMVHNNLGIIAVGEKDFQKAEEEYLEEIRINPEYDNAHYNLGVLYYMQGKYHQAEAMWKKTVKLNPNYIDAYNKLLVHYLTQKNFRRADEYRKILLQKGASVPERIERFLMKNAANHEG
ncbi:MAG: tetratricopeptide repeat protein [Candidatus Omnitrophica bacterium]|nr:tetratricopeptide repeat protein [Candidatus Omnitrophota bacterium]